MTELAFLGWHDVDWFTDLRRRRKKAPNAFAGCGIIPLMIALKAHYDGKVLVPDEPLDLPANQRVHILLMETDNSQTNRVEPTSGRTDFSKWIGVAKNTFAEAHDPGADEDALWENGPLPRNADSR
jgi:hypothetical protein